MSKKVKKNKEIDNPKAEIIKEKEKKEVKKPAIKKIVKKEKKVPKIDNSLKLDNLSVEAIDGIGPKIASKLKSVGVETLRELTQTNPVDLAQSVQGPVHRMMEYRKKAEMILQLDFSDRILNDLESKGLTIEEVIESKLDTLIEITNINKDTLMNFLNNLIQITMFLDANTCRTQSIGILHRLKEKVPEEKKPSKPPDMIGGTLDDLQLIHIDGIGPKIEKRLNSIDIFTISNLASSDPITTYVKAKVPVHRMMELRKKAQMILRLRLDDDIINSLADENYTIEGVIEEDPLVVRDVTGKDMDQIMNFIDKVVQITMFLDVSTCRSSSIGILHRAEKSSKPIEELEYWLGKEQILAKIYSDEIDRTILKFLQEEATNKSEILNHLEERSITCDIATFNNAIELMVQVELLQFDWFENNFDVHLFLISDFTIFRTPAYDIIKFAEDVRPSQLVAETYLKQVSEFFNNYKPTYEDNLLIAKKLRDPDIYVTLTLLRNRSYPLSKFPKGYGQDTVDMEKIIRSMEEAGIVTIIKDKARREWVMLLTDIRTPQFQPEYMIEKIRKNAQDGKISKDLAIKHLELLEINYDTYFEIYSKFFK